MEPIEINAGGYYLRTLRADDRVDDRPAIIEAFQDQDTRTWISDYRIDDLSDAARYIRRRAGEWADGIRCSWAVADPLTGNLLGEVGLRDLDLPDVGAEASCWTHPAYRGRGVAVDALRAALRFGFGALGLNLVRYRHHNGNNGSRRVAEKCGFTRPIREVDQVAGRSVAMLHWQVTAAEFRAVRP